MSVRLSSNKEENLTLGDFFEMIRIDVNPLITPRGWWVAAFLFGLLWAGINYIVYSFIPLTWAGHMILGGLPFMAMLAIPPMIVTSLVLRLFRQPARAIAWLTGYVFLFAIAITLFILLLAIGAVLGT